MEPRDQLSRIEGLLAQIASLLARKPPSADASPTDTHRSHNPSIGSVAITNQPLAVNVQNTPTVQAQQQGTWTVGVSGQPLSVNVANQPVQVTFSTPTRKYALISTSSPNNTQVVAAVSGKRIRVVAYAVVASGTVNVQFRSGDNTNLTGSMRLVEAGGIAHAFDGGLFQTAVGEALHINLSAPVAVGGYVVYEEV